jgi:hypothetical protein
MTITGDWYNELGSHMRLTAEPRGGITGSYVSAAGHAPGPYVLVGRHDPPALADHGTALGWTVAWRNDDNDAGCVTSWNGLYYDDAEQIRATWLLTASATQPNAWEATSVGQDVFTREIPDPDRIAHHLQQGKRPSHPQTHRREERLSGSSSG